MMLRKKSTLLFLLLFITLACTSYEKKPMPSEGLWKKCPRCRTTGMEKQTYRKQTSKNRNRKKDEGRACMLWPFYATDQYQDWEEEAESQKLTDRNPVDMAYRPRYKTKTVWVKCTLCDGIGWLKYEEKEESVVIKKKFKMEDYRLE